MIVSGQKGVYEFATKELQGDLPENTEFRIFVSEDEEYAKQSGGTAFNRLSDPVFTVKQVSDVNIEKMNYEVIGVEDDNIYIATDFVIANHGSKDAKNLVMQYSVAENEDADISEPIDITGSELYVDREIKISDYDDEADEHRKTYFRQSAVKKRYAKTVYREQDHYPAHDELGRTLPYSRVGLAVVFLHDRFNVLGVELDVLFADGVLVGVFFAHFVSLFPSPIEEPRPPLRATG